MEIKIILRDNIVESVLGSAFTPDEEPEIEIVDINKDYDDYEQLCDYADKLYADPSYAECRYDVARFPEDSKE